MAVRLFHDAFGEAPSLKRFTPGRVNLIGEHTDYNGGMVLPMALSQGIAIAITFRNDDKLRIVSDYFDGLTERSVNDGKQDHWSDYVVGAAQYARELGEVRGADIAIISDLPAGSGLSSSAALTVGLLKLARDHTGTAATDIDIAKLARRVENEFIGVPCGIMDQIAVAVAEPGQVIALDTKSLDYELVDWPEDYRAAVIHSGLYRQLNEGRYAERKAECDRAKTVIGHDDLCLMPKNDLAILAGEPEAIMRRARHCVTEQARTLAAVEALREGDMKRFGQLQNDGHASIRDDFEITLPGIDQLTEDAVAYGALGARQTGGGFGGCIVACVEESSYGAWLKQLLDAHPQAFDVLKAFDVLAGE